MGKMGICNICGNNGPLSYEHVPPRSMGNSKPAKSYHIVDIANKHRALNVENREGIHYRQQQRGIGFETICPSCNSYLGQHYVKAYTGCINELGMILHDEKEKGDEGRIGIHLEGHNVPVLAFFKHVMSNFCSTTQPGSMLDCRDFLLNYKSNNLPDRYRLFMFAVPDDEVFVCSGWTKMLLNEDGLKIATLAFVASYPAGFYLYDTEDSTAEPDPSRYGCEITPMAKQPWHTEPSFSLELPYMSIANSIPVPKTTSQLNNAK